MFMRKMKRIYKQIIIPYHYYEQTETIDLCFADEIVWMIHIYKSRVVTHFPILS